MQYCLIENGQITQGPGRLPRAWRNVSGLDKASQAELKAYGWLPVNETKPEYDKETHRLGPRNVSIGTDDVTITYPTVELELEQLGNNWKSEMVKNDKELPRYVEDVLDAMNETDFANVAQKTKDKLTAKKALRASMPEGYDPNPPTP